MSQFVLTGSLKAGFLVNEPETRLAIGCLPHNVVRPPGGLGDKEEIQFIWKPKRLDLLTDNIYD